MRCPKCGYNSFDHLDSCKKCGKDLGEHKQRYGIKSVLFPGQMQPTSAQESDSGSLVADAAVAAATATATAVGVATAAEEAESGVTDSAPEVVASNAPANESDDFGFDFMGESDEEEDLSFDELFEEAPADEDVEETISGPEAEPEAAAEGVAEFSFDSVAEDEVSEELPSETELDNDFGFELEDSSEPEAGVGPAEDLAIDDFELPAAEEDGFDFNTDEIEFEETDEESGTKEDPKSPFELPESPQHEVAPEQNQDSFAAPTLAAPEAVHDLQLDPVEPQPLAVAAVSQVAIDLTEPLSGEILTPDPVEPSLDPFAEDDELFSISEVEPVEGLAPEVATGSPDIAAETQISTAAETVGPAAVEPESGFTPFVGDDELLSVAVDRSSELRLATGVEPIEEPDTVAAAELLALGASTVAAEVEGSCRAQSPAVPSRSGLEPPLGRRLAAFICDLLILSIVAGSFIVAAEIAMSGSSERLLPSVATLINLSVPYFLVLFSLAFGYFTLFHFLVGQTPGKMLAGLRVETLDGEPLVLSQAFLRSVGSLLQLLPVGLGYLAALMSPDRRGWNDRLAGTRLISLKGRAEDLLA